MLSRILKLFLLFVLIFSSFSFTTALASETIKAPKNAVKTKVTEVIDGDTIKLKYDNKEETVRLILIDTPETKDAKKCVQLFGPEATEFTKKQLLGKEVKVELDLEERDKYGRLLAYVYLNEVMFNQILIEKGLARVTVYKPNVLHEKILKETEAASKKKKVGIWSSDAAIKSECVKTTKTTIPPVKQSGKKEVFKNCTELRKKYPKGVALGHPAYDTKHDRDKDNFACEK